MVVVKVDYVWFEGVDFGYQGVKVFFIVGKVFV